MYEVWEGTTQVSEQRVKIRKKVDHEQPSIVVGHECGTIGGDARDAELEKIRRELLTLASRVEKLKAA